MITFKKQILFISILLLWTTPLFAGESIELFDIDELPPQVILNITEETPFNNTPRWLFPVVPYDTTEKVLFGYMIGLQVADVVTTVIALDRGAVEANPFFGKDPDTGVLILGKVVMIGVTYVAINYIDDHTIRKWTLGTIDALYTGVIINNVSVISGL